MSGRRPLPGASARRRRPQAADREARAPAPSGLPQDAGPSRLARLQAEIAAAGADAMVVTAAENRRYLTGFGGSDGLVWVTRDGAALVVDFRYWEQAALESPGWRLVRHPAGGAWEETLHDLCRAERVRRLGVEASHLPVGRYFEWREKLGVEIVPLRELVERLREVKDAGEVAAIRRAAELADAALEAVLPSVRPGASEAELALAFEVEARRRGAGGMAFPTIVASGPRGSLPHATPTDRRLRAGDLVTWDYGVRLDGYCSDATRTYALGEPGPEAREAHALVVAALEVGLAAVRPGARCVDVDSAARRVIEAAGRGEQFGHGLGHGVGLEVHEGPRLSQRAGDAALAEGMVVTVEPGVYVAGRLGVRVEELAVVRAGGPEVLTRAPRGLRVL
jgi:Xaa-Pro aminopeptidase